MDEYQFEIGDEVLITMTTAPDEEDVGNVAEIEDRRMTLYGPFEVADYCVDGTWYAEFALEKGGD